MKNGCLFISCLLLLQVKVVAGTHDSTVHYTLADSLKANGWLVQVTPTAINGKKSVKAGISLDEISVYLESDRKEREVVMEYPRQATLMAEGLGVEKEKGEITWEFPWNLNDSYDLYIATASDSAGNFTLYSGYIHFPQTNKWKLLGTCRIEGRWGGTKNATTFFSHHRKREFKITTHSIWLQGITGWKNMQASSAPAPVLQPFSNIDSLEQVVLDEKMIKGSMNENPASAMKEVQSVYYSILKEGEGEKVSVTDTVTVFYKGYLLKDGSVFDQTKEKPATFPLGRLIKGWQLALPECKKGGKIKIIIPSGQGYSIRTRGPKIPPNSVLVFEIEVVDIKRKA